MNSNTYLLLAKIRSWKTGQAFIAVMLAACVLLTGCQTVPNNTEAQLCAAAKMAKQQFMAGKWAAAAEGFESAINSARTNEDKAVCALLAAQSLACNKEYQRAAELADEAVRLCPKNEQIAAKRLAFWTAAKDRRQIDLAQAHLANLNPSFRGKVVCDPVTGMIIITGIVVVGITVWIFSVPEEDRAEVVKMAVKSVSPPVSMPLERVLL